MGFYGSFMDVSFNSSQHRHQYLKLAFESQTDSFKGETRHFLSHYGMWLRIYVTLTIKTKKITELCQTKKRALRLVSSTPHLAVVPVSSQNIIVCGRTVKCMHYVKTNPIARTDKNNLRKSLKSPYLAFSKRKQIFKTFGKVSWPVPNLNFCFF